jgi:hypothetical protein
VVLYRRDGAELPCVIRAVPHPPARPPPPEPERGRPGDTAAACLLQILPYSFDSPPPPPPPPTVAAAAGAPYLQSAAAAAAAASSESVDGGAAAGAIELYPEHIAGGIRLDPAVRAYLRAARRASRRLRRRARAEAALAAAGAAPFASSSSDSDAAGAAAAGRRHGQSFTLAGGSESSITAADAGLSDFDVGLSPAAAALR